MTASRLQPPVRDAISRRSHALEVLALRVDQGHHDGGDAQYLRCEAGKAVEALILGSFEKPCVMESREPARAG